MTRPTREQIEESQRICEKATEGEWIAGTVLCDFPRVHLLRLGPYPRVQEIDSNDDLKFCAHARTELPARNQQCLELLEENERLRRKLEAGIAACEKYINDASWNSHYQNAATTIFAALEKCPA